VRMGKLMQGPRLLQALVNPLSAAIAFAAPLCLFGAGALAADPEEAPGLPGGDVPEESAEPAELDPVAAEMQELRDRLKQLEEQQVKKAASPLSINGYVDFGFFVPIGNHGVGVVED